MLDTRFGHWDAPGHRGLDLPFTVPEGRQAALVEPCQMTLVSRLWHGIADHFRLRLISWVMSINMLGFGTILLLNPAVLELPGRTVLYSDLLRLATPHTWGLVCITLGLFRFVALTVNGTFPEFTLSPHVRAVGSFLSCLFWLQIVLGALRADQLTLALDVFSIFLVFDTISLYSAMLEINPEGARKRGEGGA